MYSVSKLSCRGSSQNVFVFFDEITHVFYYQSVQYKGFLGLQMILVEGPGSWYSGG